MGWILIFWLVILLVLAGTFRVLRQANLQGELANAVDAAAHAAASDLADDIVLTDRPDLRPQMTSACRRTSQRLGRYHRVGGTPFELELNEANDTEGEIVLGCVPTLAEKTIRVDAAGELNIYRPDLNAIRVLARREGAVASATVIADHDVIGFQVRPGVPVTDVDPDKLVPPPVVPMVPLAIRTDPCPPDNNTLECWQERAAGSWEREIMARKGSDRWRIDAATGGVVEGPDQIPEIEVVLDKQPGGGNLHLAGLGTATPVADMVRQTARGITFRDLKERNGRLTLETPGQKENLIELPTTGASEEELGELAQRLRGMLGQPRIWMLYSELRTNEETKEQRLAVVGFVAARVMEVRSPPAEEDGKDTTSSYGQLIATLQPSVMNVSTAVTDHRLRDRGPRTIYNPYIAKVRIVE